MTAEVLAPIIGLSLGVGSFAGWAAANWHRDHVPYGHKQLLQYVYPFIDGRIGATATENLRRANRRFKFAHPRLRHFYLFLIPNNRKLPWRDRIANYFWPEVKLARDGNPLPEPKRIARYVQLEFRGDTSFANPYRVWNIQAITVWPTSEVDVHTHGFEASLARWVTWAMRLKDPDQLEIQGHPELGYWRLARKGPAREMRTDVPHEVGIDA